MKPLILAFLCMMVAGCASAHPLPWLYSGPGYAPQLPPSPPPSVCPFGTGSGDNGCAASTTLAISNAGTIDANFAKDTASSGQLPQSPTTGNVTQRNAWLHNGSYNIPGVDYAVGSENPSSGGLVPISLFPCTENDLDNGTCNATTYPTQSDGICTYEPTGFATGSFLGNGPYLKCQGLGASAKEKIQGYDFSNTTATFTSLAGASGSGAAGVQITGTNDPTSEYDFIDDFFQGNLETSTPFTASQTAGVMTVTSAVQLWPGQPVTGPGVPSGETVTGELGTLYSFSNNQTLGSSGSPVSLACGGVSFSGFLSGSSLTVTTPSTGTTLPAGCTLTGTGVSCASVGGIGGCPIVVPYQATRWTVSNTSTVASGTWNSPQNDIWQTAHMAGAVGAYPFFIGPPSTATWPIIKYTNITVDGNVRYAKSINMIDENYRAFAINDNREGPTLPYNYSSYLTYVAIYDIGHNPMTGIGGGGVIAKYNFFRGNCQVQHDLCHGEIAEMGAAQSTRALEQYIGNVFVQNPAYCGAQGYYSTSITCGQATAAMYLTSGTQNNTIFGEVDVENNVVVINNVQCTVAPDYTKNPFPGDGFGPNNTCGSSTQGAGDGLFAISGVTSIGKFVVTNNVLDGTGTIYGYSNGFQDALDPPVVTSPGAGTVVNKLVPEINTLLIAGGVEGGWWPGMWVHVNSNVWSNFTDTSIASTYPTGANTYNVGYPNFIGSTSGSSTTLTTTTSQTLNANDILYNMSASTVPAGYQLNNEVGANIATTATGTSFTMTKAITIASGTRMYASNATNTCAPPSESNCGTLTLSTSEPAMPVQTFTAASNSAAGTNVVFWGAGSQPTWVSTSTVGDNGYIFYDLTNPNAIAPSSYASGIHNPGASSDGIILHQNLLQQVTTGDTIAAYPIFQIFTHIGTTTPMTAQSGNVAIGGAYATRLSSGLTTINIPPTTGVDGTTNGQSWGNVACQGTSGGC